MDQQTYVQTKPLLESQVVGGTSKAKDCKTEQIHGYPSRVQVGRGSDGEGHWGIWAGAVSLKRSKTPKTKMGTDRPTDRPTDGRTKPLIELLVHGN